MTKNTFTLLVTLMLVPVILTTVSSCKKEPKDDTPNEEYPTSIITGTVELPAGTTDDVNTMHVLSAFEEKGITNGSYEAEVFTNEFTTQMVTNSNDEVIMMGYSYPGQTDHTINSRSTALALLMNTPAAMFLSAQAKPLFIENILASPDLNNLVQEVEASVQQNTGLFDTINTDIIPAMEALFYSASFKTQWVPEAPVSLMHAGRNFVFMNPGISHSTVVGIYHGGVRVKKIEVEGVDIFPSSFSEIINSIQVNVDNPVEYPYTLSGDEDFDIKVRTGRPGDDDGSTEYNEARWANFTDFGCDAVGAIWPPSKNTTCKQSIRAVIKNVVINSWELNQPKTVSEIPGLLYEVINIAFESEDEIRANCVYFKPNAKWFYKFQKYFNFLQKGINVISNVATGMNLTRFATQWATTPSALDTCFWVEGNTFSSCYEAPCDGSLNVTESLNGKTVTASATGGTPPYQFSCYNRYSANGGFSSNNTFTLASDGEYYVYVKDAHGCMDTIKGCVSDVIVNRFSVAYADSSGPTPFVRADLEYTSPLGLYPEFLVKYNGYDYCLPVVAGYGMHVISSNVGHYGPDQTWCTNTSGSGVLVKPNYGSTAITGDNYHRTIRYTFQNDNQPLGSSVLTFRLRDMCGGISLCPTGPYHQNVLLSQQVYTLQW